MRDKTGRVIEEGMMVDVVLPVQALTGRVVKIVTNPVHTPQGNMPPHILVQLEPFFALSRDGGSLQSVYIVDETTANPKVHLEESGRPKLVQ